MKSMIAEYVGGQIRDLRKQTGLSQEDLASKLGVPSNTVSRWETATYKPKLKDLDKLADVFGVSVSEFFPSSDVTEPVAALMRKAKDLPQEDIDALLEFAEFKRAQHLLKKDG
jgi:transcriptional regulator with XRE-family HTH domain